MVEIINLSVITPRAATLDHWYYRACVKVNNSSNSFNSFFPSDTILIKANIEGAMDELRKHELEHTVRYVTWAVSKYFGRTGKKSLR